jgi:hypothetical protein
MKKKTIIAVYLISILDDPQDCVHPELMRIIIE